MKKESYTKEELLSCGRGELFGEGNARLPLPPMLMFDRIKTITEEGGKYNNGQIIAELDINKDLWFFKLHWPGDPNMPASLQLESLTQICALPILSMNENIGKFMYVVSASNLNPGRLTTDIA